MSEEDKKNTFVSWLKGVLGILPVPVVSMFPVPEKPKPPKPKPANDGKKK